MKTEISNTHLWPTLDKASGASQAVKAGDTIHVAATLGLDAEGKLTSDVNMAMQMRQAYRNVEAALGRLGAGLGNVVSETVYVTSLEQARVAGLLAQVYGQQPPPARTLVEVSALAMPAAMVAIACIAVL